MFSSFAKSASTSPYAARDLPTLPKLDAEMAPSTGSTKMGAVVGFVVVVVFLVVVVVGFFVVAVVVEELVVVVVAVVVIVVVVFSVVVVASSIVLLSIDVVVVSGLLGIVEMVVMGVLSIFSVVVPQLARDKVMMQTSINEIIFRIFVTICFLQTSAF